jgi:hypothetical protein
MMPEEPRPSRRSCSRAAPGSRAARHAPPQAGPAHRGHRPCHLAPPAPRTWPWAGPDNSRDPRTGRFLPAMTAGCGGDQGGRGRDRPVRAPPVCALHGRRVVIVARRVEVVCAAMRAGYEVCVPLPWATSLLGLRCPLPVSVARAVSAAGAVFAADDPPSASSGSSAASEALAFLYLRNAAANALAAAVAADRPTALRQRRRGFSGSSRRAAADSSDETLGATSCWTTCPAFSTCGAAQARVLSAWCLAAVPAVFANGMTLSAAG